MNKLQQSGLYLKDLLCPLCSEQGEQIKGSEKGNYWYCKQHEHAFSLTILCPDCSKEVHRVKSCGGREEYYCEHCRGQKSRCSVSYILEPKGR